MAPISKRKEAYDQFEAEMEAALPGPGNYEVISIAESGNGECVENVNAEYVSGTEQAVTKEVITYRFVLENDVYKVIR